VKTLDALDRSRMLDYLRAKYVASATLIVAAGNLRHAQVVKAVARVAPAFRDGKRPIFLPVTNGQAQPRVRLHTKQVEQTQIALGFRACSRHDERRHALRVLNALLGENMSSRLWQVLREDHGLAYNIYSTPSFFDDTGDLVISAGLETGNLQKALKLIIHEARRLIESPAPVAELRRARDYLIGQTDLSLESTENQMMWVGEQLLSYGRIYPPEDFKERISKVTAAQVRSAARDFIRPARACLAIISPLKRVSGVAAILAGL
jgi:predicted Zn-dependent peptidase